MRPVRLILFAMLIFLPGLQSCVRPGEEKTVIAYVNSYHRGYGSSDSIMAGLNRVIPDSVAFHSFYLDSKRNSAETYLDSAAGAIAEEIRELDADLLIFSDDNAVKSVLLPHFTRDPIPVVFCGVNWSADAYGLPTQNVCGMLEVLPLEALSDTLLNYFPGAKRLLVLTEESYSSHRDSTIVDSLIRTRGLEPSFHFAAAYDEWETSMRNAEDFADAVFIPTNGSIRDWDDRAARSLLEEHMRIPVITCDDFMIPYAHYGLMKIASEQGEWAASTALRILTGKVDAADIPLARNRHMEVLVNQELIQNPFLRK